MGGVNFIYSWAQPKNVDVVVKVGKLEIFVWLREK